jgi:membrane associated rhomboid family serine protease
VATLGPNTAQTGGIAYWAHIGGFVLGLIVGFLARALVPEQEREIARDRDRRF